MNHLVEEHCNVNHDSYAYNTRSKRRVVEDVTPPPLDQASTSSAVPHVHIISHQHNASQPANAPRQKR